MRSDDVRSELRSRIERAVRGSPESARVSTEDLPEGRRASVRPSAGSGAPRRARKGRRDGGGQAAAKRKRAVAPRPAGAPYWLPRGPFWDRLSEGVKRAVGEVLEPAYRRLVLEARDELERSAGITLVHLMWLEICDQAAMSDMVGNRKEIDAILNDPEESVGRHLHLVAAKNSTAELLLKLRMVRETIQRGERVFALPGTVPSLPAPAAPFPRSRPVDESPIVGRIGNPPHNEAGPEPCLPPE